MLILCKEKPNGINFNLNKFIKNIKINTCKKKYKKTLPQAQNRLNLIESIPRLKYYEYQLKMTDFFLK